MSTLKKDEYVKENGEKLTWHDYAKKVFDLLISRHPNSKTIIVVNDYYGYDVINPKDSERITRGKKFVGGNFPNVYPVGNKELPTVRLFKDFFKNNNNKERLQTFLLTEFHSMCQKRGVQMVYCMRNKCIEISVSPMKEISRYKNQKIEADNAIFYIYNQIRKSGDDTTVVCDASDTDILVTAAFVTTKVSGVLGIKMKKGIFDCAQLLSKEIAAVAIRAHAMSGTDCISSFFGVGKKTIWKRIMRSKEAQQLLMTMDEDSLRKFTIKHVYNDKISKTLAEMRMIRWNNAKKKDFARIGIDEDTHVNRSKRVIFAVSSIEHFNHPEEFGNPLLYGFMVNERMKCVPVKYGKDALPEKLRQSVLTNSSQQTTTKVTSEGNGDESDDEEPEDEDGEDSCSEVDI